LRGRQLYQRCGRFVMTPRGDGRIFVNRLRQYLLEGFERITPRTYQERCVNCSDRYPCDCCRFEARPFERGYLGESVTELTVATAASNLSMSR
jgi:hypothetical protein